MGALLYITKRSFINNMKKAVRKPVTLLLMVGIVVYLIFIAFSLGMMVQELHFSSPTGLVAVVTFWVLYIFVANFISYFSRKGILFRPGHTHFVFPSPISPKLVLLHSAWMNYLMSIGVNFILTIGGMTVFQVAPWRMILFFLAGTGMELSFEISIMMILYTNEWFSEQVTRRICLVLKGLLILMTAGIVWYFFRNGLSLSTVTNFVDLPQLQMLPVVGWNIAFYRLILLGPDTLNTICGILYVLVAVLAVTVAYRMKCEGNYYEDAAKFADNYAEMRQRKKNGEMVMGLEHKKKYKTVSGGYRATGAKAIFYRQLLEYKKERFFIFNSMTLICLILSVVLAQSMRDGARETGLPQLFLLGIVAYMTLILTGYLGKWNEELKNPYLYLIPDSAVRKLWYATLMEHVKALVDGCVLCIPIGILWKIHPVQLVLAILIFAVLQANKLYTKVLAQCLVGDLLGKVGQDITRAVMQMFVLGFGIAAAVIVGLLADVNLIFPIVLVYSLVVTVILGLLASIRFDRMEQIV